MTEFQRVGTDRARETMERYGGVLYADGVGMGKTEIALNFIREHVEEHGHHVLVVASAQLRDSLWEPRLKREILQGDYSEGGMSVRECASRIVKLVDELRLIAVSLPAAPKPIQPNDLGVVCYQVVLPAT